MVLSVNPPVTTVTTDDTWLNLVCKRNLEAFPESFLQLVLAVPWPTLGSSAMKTAMITNMLAMEEVVKWE